MTIAKKVDLGVKVDLVNRVLDPNRLDFPLRCYRCTYEPLDKQDYNRHCCREHRGFPGYPNKASLDKYGLEPQGMDWEK